MAFLEQRGQRFRLIFRHAGRRYGHNLKTKDESIANSMMGGIENRMAAAQARFSSGQVVWHS